MSERSERITTDGRITSDGRSGHGRTPQTVSHVFDWTVRP